MLSTIRDDTWTVLNIQHTTPNLKRWGYSDAPGNGHEKLWMHMWCKKAIDKGWMDRQIVLASDQISHWTKVKMTEHDVINVKWRNIECFVIDVKWKKGNWFHLNILFTKCIVSVISETCQNIGLKIIYMNLYEKNIQPLFKMCKVSCLKWCSDCKKGQITNQVIMPMSDEVTSNKQEINQGTLSLHLIKFQTNGPIPSTFSCANKVRN